MEKFTFYKSWAETIKDLPKNLQLEAFFALIDYAFYEISPKESANSTIKVLFSMSKAFIDEDEEKETHLSKTRKLAAYKRWNKDFDEDVNDAKMQTCKNANMQTCKNANAVLHKTKESFPPHPLYKENILKENSKKESEEETQIDPDSKLGKMRVWMERYTPYIYKNIPKQYTEVELNKLLSAYTIEQICSVLVNIENRKDLRKRYVSLYLTSLNWLKHEYGKAK